MKQLQTTTNTRIRLSRPAVTTCVPHYAPSSVPLTPASDVQVSLSDPVRSIKMIPFLRGKLADVQALQGGPEAFQAAHLDRVDPAVLEELYKRLQGQIQG